MLSKDTITRIYKLYSKEIYRYLLKLTRNQDVSEDLLQEVFEKFIAYTAEKTVLEDKYRPFLYRTAHNLCVNHFIKQDRARLDSLDDTGEYLRIEDTTLDGVIMDDLNKKIYSILNGIDPESRSIFIMHKEGGLTYEEIAVNLSMSERTVRRRVKEVLTILFDALKKEGFL